MPVLQNCFTVAVIAVVILTVEGSATKGLAQNLQKLHDYVSRVEATWEEFR